MEEFTLNSAVRGCHLYQYVSKPAVGEKLHAEQEFNKAMHKFAVRVIKSNEMVSHLPCK